MAQCDGSGAICMASIACGIGGLDRRTQRRAQHVFCVVIAGSLHTVRGVEPAIAPSGVDHVLCGRIDVQANAGDPSFHFLVARLLAAKAGLFPVSSFGSGEGAVLLTDRSIEYCHLCGATEERSGGHSR